MTKKEPSKWNLHVKSVFAKGRADNKDYKFKQALKDAAKTWSGSSSSEAKGKKEKKSKKSKKQMGGDKDEVETDPMKEGEETSTPQEEMTSGGAKKSKKSKKRTMKGGKKSRKGKKSGKKTRKNRM